MDEAKIKRLDWFERYPHGYDRVKIKVTVTDDWQHLDPAHIARLTAANGYAGSGHVVSCWMYVVRNFRPHFLSHPTYPSYYNGMEGRTFIYPPSEDDVFCRILADDCTLYDDTCTICACAQ